LILKKKEESPILLPSNSSTPTIHSSL